MPYIALDAKDAKDIKRLEKELGIPEDRDEFLIGVMRDVLFGDPEKNKTNVEEFLDPTSVISKFITATKKANELAFLCFLYGVLHNAVQTAETWEEEKKDLVLKAARYGAEKATQGIFPDGMTPPAAIKAKLQNDDENTEQDRMYQ